MNRELANNRISQLPIGMFGIFSAFLANGISLSIFGYTNKPIARRRLL